MHQETARRNLRAVSVSILQEEKKTQILIFMVGEAQYKLNFLSHANELFQ